MIMMMMLIIIVILIIPILIILIIIMMIIMKTLDSYINGYAKRLLYAQQQVCCVAGCDVAK